MHITFNQPVPWFSTPLRLLSKLGHPEGLGLDGLTEQSAKL